MKRFGLPRQARLTRSRDFKEVSRRGSRLRAPPLLVKALARREGRSRMGLAVSRQVGSAVVRNRWRRAIREAFRLNRHRLGRPYDLVFSVFREAEPDEVKEVERAFLEVVERLNADDAEAAPTDTTD